MQQGGPQHVVVPARGYLFVTGAAVLWGVAGAVAKYLFSARSVAPFLLVQVRMGLSALLLAAGLAFFAPRLLKINRSDLGFLIIFGTVGMAAVQFTYLFTIDVTNVATAIFLQYLAPILTAAYAWLVERQPLGLRVLLCVALALGGSVLLIFGGTAQLQVRPLGLFTGLLSALFMSFYTIVGAKGVSRLSPWTLLCFGLGIGFLFWLLVDGALALTGRFTLPLAALTDPSLWSFFGYIAILATIVPFGLYLTGLKSVSPTMAILTGMLEPLTATLASFLLLGERLLGLQMLGGALIVLAVVLLQFAQPRTN